jgi:alanine racemase
MMSHANADELHTALQGPGLTPAVLPEPARQALRHGPAMIVDLAAIQSNYRALSRATRGSCAAIVKGDGYGHGMLQAARAVVQIGADLFFTARFDDAVELRKAVGAAPQIAVLDGLSAALLPEAGAAGIIPVVNSLDQLAAVAQFARSRSQRMPVYLHIDTAMNRLGIAADEIDTARPLLRELGVKAYMTHLASADDVDIELCRRQVERVKSICSSLPRAPISIANSCGVFLGEEFHGDIIRPGKSLFGINPLPEGRNPLAQPAAVFAPVVQVRTLAKGDPVGYSSTWHAPNRRRIAVLAIGYANGLLRTNSNSGVVFFDGRAAPVVGRVSMDLTTVDITSLPVGSVGEGSIAEIVGPNNSYRNYARHCDTIEHEAIISLGRGCQRFFVGRSDADRQPANS